MPYSGSLLETPYIAARWFWVALPLCLLTIAAAGCSPPDEIRRYTIARPALKDRMLAAIVPRGNRVWFFKVSGNEVALAAQSKAFVEMVRSLNFDSDGEPTWTAPDDWRPKEDNTPRGPLSSRFATLEIGGEGGPYELAVTALGMPSEDLSGYVLANVNRWRGQLGLRPISEKQLPKKTTQFDLDGSQVTIVNLLGNLPEAPAMSPPRNSVARPSTFAPPSGPSIKFDTPQGWAQGELMVARGGIQIRRQAAFDVKQDDESVEITATRMPGSPSSLLLNVNRWRGQVQLDPFTEAELEADGKKIDIDGAIGTYVELKGAKATILGVVAYRDGMAWFIKLQGDRELAQQEQAHFDEFLKSIRFE